MNLRELSRLGKTAHRAMSGGSRELRAAADAARDVADLLDVGSAVVKRVSENSSLGVLVGAVGAMATKVAQAKSAPVQRQAKPSQRAPATPSFRERLKVRPEPSVVIDVQPEDEPKRR